MQPQALKQKVVACYPSLYLRFLVCLGKTGLREELGQKAKDHKKIPKIASYSVSLLHPKWDLYHSKYHLKFVLVCEATL